MPEYRLSPSDFAFLWEECHRCFYLKYVTGFKRPGGPFPRIFGVIDLAMRKHYIDGRTDAMSPDLPPGTMTYGEKWVHSAPIHLPGHESTLVLRGKLDAARGLGKRAVKHLRQGRSCLGFIANLDELIDAAADPSDMAPQIIPT